MTERAQQRWDGLLVGCVALGCLVWGVSAWWLGRNELPDGYQNEFLHLYTLTEVWFRLRDEGLGAAWPFLWEGYWPPGMHVVAVGAVAAFGASLRVAVLALALAVFPLLLATGDLGRRLGDAWTGAAAAVLLACAPGVFGLARRYEPNLLLVALVAVGLWWLARGGLRSTREAVGFGLLCAAGLLVDRVVFALYLAGPALVWIATEREQRRRWLVAAALTLVVAGPYYALFLSEHVGEVTSQLGGEIDASGGTQAPLPPLVALGYYPLSWLGGDLGVPGALFVFGGLAGWIRGRRSTPAAVRRTLESALIVGLVAFSLIGKKQPYYGLPLLVPAALMAAGGWRAVLGPRARTAVLIVLVLLGLNQVAFRSTGRAPVPVDALTGGPVLGDLLGERYVLAGPPLELGLDLARAAELCGDRPTLLVAEQPKEGLVLPMVRLHLDRGDVPGRTVEAEAFAERAPAAQCLVWVGETDGADDALVRARGRPLGGWGRHGGPRVHVYALSAGPR